MIRRFSTRTHRLDFEFLAEQLEQARSYRRIAGYFTSSLFEVAAEWIDDIPDVRIVCNADLTAEDLRVAQVLEARLLGRWNQRSIETEALLNKERYQRLYAFLEKRGQVIRVAPDSLCGFVHGKAGVIERADGVKVGFIGSMNETRSGWREHYEILWEDDSPEGVQWIEEEFEYLWNGARPLPDAVCREIKRRSRRKEVEPKDLGGPEEIAPAALVESPLYREGFSLQPWQQGFVAECMRHLRDYGAVRLLLADEVGLGKTLSMGTAALALGLEANRAGRRPLPVAIFAPATLCEQWQVEMLDKLGIPCARWSSLQKVWLDSEKRPVSPTGPEQVVHCPFRIGIISTGLLVQPTREKELLGQLCFEVLVLDEAHKARTRQARGKQADTPNELLAFALGAAGRAQHVLLGTATPVQTKPEDLWDLVRILHQGTSGHFVLGNDFSPWHKPAEVLNIITGEEAVNSAEEAWRLLRSPLPTVESTDEQGARQLFYAIRESLGLSGPRFEAGAFTQIEPEVRDDIEDRLTADRTKPLFFQRHNPFVRHVVLRKRKVLEDQGLLRPVGVDVHPNRELSQDPQQFTALFEGVGLRTTEDFDLAYRAAQDYGKVLGQRGKGSGFMKNLMAQRVCSSRAAGLATAKRLLQGETLEEEMDDEEVARLDIQGQAEKDALSGLIRHLERMEEDPKLKAVLTYFEREGWMEYGCIVFSQYYDTAEWIAERLAERFPAENLGLYAGADKSRLFHRGDSVRTGRDGLKALVQERQIRIMVATDAACEGLNLQTLGTLINIDLPWNPTRLEQRIGRIKRFGQTRDKVDMLNLVYQGTVDEKVYERLSERMRDRYDLFGALPDTIKDEWIERIEELDEYMAQYIEERRQATGYDVRYNDSLRAAEHAWRDCEKVLSAKELEKWLRTGW